MKERVEIVASGFGGQGVVRLGQILGQAAVKQGLHVTMLKSHGTEMRGGYVRSQVVMSPKNIDSPICESPDYFIALSLAAYNRFKDTVPEGGVILYDPAFVDRLDDGLACRQLSVPAKQLSVEKFNRPIFANTIILVPWPGTWSSWTRMSSWTASWQSSPSFRPRTGRLSRWVMTALNREKST